jgi:hypothetical protein
MIVQKSSVGAWVVVGSVDRHGDFLQTGGSFTEPPKTAKVQAWSKTNVDSLERKARVLLYGLPSNFHIYSK